VSAISPFTAGVIGGSSRTQFVAGKRRGVDVVVELSSQLEDDDVPRSGREDRQDQRDAKGSE